MKASQRHVSIRGEVLSARKILDAHLSPRTDMYLWEKELIGDLVKHSEDMISNNQRCGQKLFSKTWKLVSVDVHQLVLAAENYWSSELLSVGIEVLEKLDALYKLVVGSSDSTFFPSKALTLIYDVAIYLLNSKYLKGRLEESMRENMISLRRTDASKNVLHQVIVEYISSKSKLSCAKIGMIAMIILGSGKLNFKLCNKLLKKTGVQSTMKDFIENLCASTGPGNTTQEPRELTVMWRFFEALVETYNVNWRLVEDYITPSCFLYLVERLLIWATCFQGYVITTSSCFTELLMYQDEGTTLISIVDDVRPSIQGNEGILHFIVNVVSECLCERRNLIEWIKKSNADWKSCYSLLVPRLIVLLCLLYVNFGMCLDILSDLLGRSYITEQLPWEFYDTLKRMRKHNSVNINVEALAAALKKIDNTLVIASFGFDCSSFLCSDAIFVDMKANKCKDGIVRKMFPNHLSFKLHKFKLALLKMKHKLCQKKLKLKLMKVSAM
ncbi:hypothetical protein M0R45_019413 [Rubus argutus]|uniref:Uncharacterized protein n=1 Tax=Rubus argutus TaxID=59490 RepID=A0AAW1X5R3_RUBAR